MRYVGMSIDSTNLPTSIDVPVKLTLVSTKPALGGCHVVYAAELMGVRIELQVVCGESELADVPARIERMFRAVLAKPRESTREQERVVYTGRPRSEWDRVDEPVNWMGW
jgi:hypothetical protein